MKFVFSSSLLILAGIAFALHCKRLVDGDHSTFRWAIAGLMLALMVF